MGVLERWSVRASGCDWRDVGMGCHPVIQVPLRPGVAEEEEAVAEPHYGIGEPSASRRDRCSCWSSSAQLRPVSAGAFGLDRRLLVALE
jgi:hypothetical protein